MTLGRIEVPFGGQNLVIESGQLAKQANGAVTISLGGTVVLVTACMARSAKEGIDFFPLTVDYQEKTYAAGRIPGGFFKREGRPSENEILAGRVIDRPIRPLFPKGLYNEVQVVALVLSSDGENDPDILAINGASAALMVSDIPFEGPIGAVRVGFQDGQYLLNPTYAQREKSLMDLIVVGWEDKIIMIEGEAREATEEQIHGGLKFGFEKLQQVKALQQELAKTCGKKKMDVPLRKVNDALLKKVEELTAKKLWEIYQIAQKEVREDRTVTLVKELLADVSSFETYAQDGQEISEADIKNAFHDIEADVVRRLILEEGRRTDGRRLNEIRPIGCQVNILPRTHGSSLFTRGQTQSLSIATLGTGNDEQIIEALEGKSTKTFMLHYNFPSFSVGETKPNRGPGRREIGHGALAEKALKAVMPASEHFPYTVRLVSEILESNGSSSMATVCAGTLCLMDAGVPLKEAVAGISIGLVSSSQKSVLLTDIMGLEDHFGDMDFKVAGSRHGLTAIQLDLKIRGISLELLKEGLAQAKEARLFILDKMYQTISTPRSEISPYAPRIETLHIPQDKIAEVIGPGGKTIRRITEENNVTIDIEDDGTVKIASTDAAGVKKAVDIIKSMTEEVEVGKIYTGVVKRVLNFGAFCEILPGKEGLVHISELAHSFVKDINSAVKVGDTFKVKVIEIDELNRINLSKKQADEAPISK